MAKKKKNIEQNVVKKAEAKLLKERLENFMVMAVSLVLVYAVVFAVFYNYMGSFVTGMMRLCTALYWLNLVGVVALAVWGFLKKDNRFFKWCAFCAANAVIWFFFLRFGRSSSTILYCYCALMILLIAAIFYYFLALHKKWEKKGVRRVYFIILDIAILLYLISAVVSMYLGGNITGYAH